MTGSRSARLHVDTIDEVTCLLAEAEGMIEVAASYVSDLQHAGSSLDPALSGAARLVGLARGLLADG